MTDDEADVLHRLLAAYVLLQERVRVSEDPPRPVHFTDIQLEAAVLLGKHEFDKEKARNER